MLIPVVDSVARAPAWGKTEASRPDLGERRLTGIALLGKDVLSRFRGSAANRQATIQAAVRERLVRS
jgi:hypothetical protein